MNGFSNENIKDKLCGGCDCAGFVPKLDFTYDPGAGTITFVDTSTIPAGDAAKMVQITVRDKNAKKVFANIPVADVDNTIVTNVAALDASGGLTIEATVITDKGCVSDGRFDMVGIFALVGTLSYWDKDNNAIA